MINIDIWGAPDCHNWENLAYIDILIFFLPSVYNVCLMMAHNSSYWLVINVGSNFFSFVDMQTHLFMVNKPNNSLLTLDYKCKP